MSSPLLKLHRFLSKLRDSASSHESNGIVVDLVCLIHEHPDVLTKLAAAAAKVVPEPKGKVTVAEQLKPLVTLMGPSHHNIGPAFERISDAVAWVEGIRRES